MVVHNWRIGDRVESLIESVFVYEGLQGLVVNVAPPRYGKPTQIRVLWDNDTVCIFDTLQVRLLEKTPISAKDEI